MIEVIFETHSTSVDNEDGVASGHWDAPLSALGKLQAAELGLRYGPGTVRGVFCSDLQRSYRTAEIAFRERGDITVRKDPRLRECDYGNWNRAARSRVDSSRAGRVHLPFPNGESYVECANRVRAFLVDLWQESQYPRALIIGHRATQYALEHLLNGKRLEDVIGEQWTWQPGWTYSLTAPPSVGKLQDRS